MYPPGVKINGANSLIKELVKYSNEDTIATAIKLFDVI
jgi:hypothetical protein